MVRKQPLWKKRVLGYLEDAVQVLGPQSERTRSSYASEAMIDAIGQIDEIGEEIKNIDESLP